MGGNGSGFDPPSRAETRRLVSWWDHKFGPEVSEPLVFEKVMKRFMGMGHPESSVIRIAHQNMKIHLDYIAWLTERATWATSRACVNRVRW